MINISINGKSYAVQEGKTVLEAAKENGIYIPTLCAYEGMNPKAACKLCIVKIEGESSEKLACATKVKEGMSICTDDDGLFAKRKATVTEMFRQHTVDCHHCMRIGSTLSKDFDPKFCKDCYFCDCVRDGFCELQEKALEFGIDVLPFEPQEHDFAIDDSTGSLVRNPNKCIKCRRCVDICKAQGVGILGLVKTENGQTVGAKTTLMAEGCVRCGRCVEVCPTGALFMKEHKDEEIYFAHQYGTKTAALVNSNVIPELEKLFGAENGSFKLEQIVDGMKKLGVDEVYDAKSFACESNAKAAEMLDERLGKGCVIMTDDYAAKSFLNTHYPELKDSFLLCDSAEKLFADSVKAVSPDTKLYAVSAKNSVGAEAADHGVADYFINARELYRIFLRCGVDPKQRKGLSPEQPYCVDCNGKYKELFEISGWSLDSQPEEKILTVDGKEYKALVCHNLGQVKKAVEKMKDYDIIKIIG